MKSIFVRWDMVQRTSRSPSRKQPEKEPRDNNTQIHQLQWHNTQPLQNDIGQEEMSRSPGLQCNCEFFGNFGGSVCEIADELPVGCCEEEDEDDVDEEEKKVLLEKGVLDPTTCSIALYVRQSY